MKRVLAAMILTGAVLGLLPGRGLAENAIYVYGGQCSTRPHDVTIQQPISGNFLVVDDAHFTDDSFVGPIYYGIRASHFFKNNPHWGIEAEFFHPKARMEVDREYDIRGEWHGKDADQKDAKIDDYIQSFEISHGFNFLLLNGVYRYGFFKTDRIPYGRLQLLMRAGAGITILHPESKIDEQRRYIESGGYEIGDFGFQLSPGIEFTIFRGLDGFADYKYTYAEMDHVTIKYGTADTVFTTDHIDFGLSYHFK